MSPKPQLDDMCLFWSL